MSTQSCTAFNFYLQLTLKTNIFFAYLPFFFSIFFKFYWIWRKKREKKLEFTWNVFQELKKKKKQSGSYSGSTEGIYIECLWITVTIAIFSTLSIPACFYETRLFTNYTTWFTKPSKNQIFQLKLPDIAKDSRYCSQ